MIIQTSKDQAIEITSSPVKMAQKIHEQTIEIEKLRKQATVENLRANKILEQNKTLIEDAEELARIVYAASRAFIEMDLSVPKLEEVSMKALGIHKTLMREKRIKPDKI